MKLKYEMALARFGDHDIAVPVGETTAGKRKVIECNETASAILRLLEQDTTEADIIAALREEYEADPGVIENEVHRVITLLRESDVLI